MEKDTIETKIVDKKEKVEEKIEKGESLKDDTKEKLKETKDKGKEKLSEEKEKLKETKDKGKEKLSEEKEKLKETKDKGKEVAEKVEKDISSGVDSIFDNVKNVQQIIDNKLSEYQLSSVKNIDIELLEDENKYYMRAAVPGIKKDEIDITADDRSISIEVTFKPLSENFEEEINVIENGIKIGRCVRTIKFESDIDLENISAKYNLGFVELEIAKFVKPKQKVNIE